MSFTRFRKERSKAPSVQGGEDYAEAVRQQDNLSQHSGNSKGSQNQYQPRPQTMTQEKPRSINQSQNLNPRFNNDINNLPQSKGNSHNPSISSSSSAADQYICNNCINEALIYEKQLNSKNNDRPPIAYKEDPQEVQDRLAAMERERLNNKINERMGLAQQAGK